MFEELNTDWDVSTESSCLNDQLFSQVPKSKAKRKAQKNQAVSGKELKKAKKRKIPVGKTAEDDQIAEIPAKSPKLISFASEPVPVNLKEDAVVLKKSNKKKKKKNDSRKNKFKNPEYTSLKTSCSADSEQQKEGAIICDSNSKESAGKSFSEEVRLSPEDVKKAKNARRKERRKARKMNKDTMSPTSSLVASFQNSDISEDPKPTKVKQTNISEEPEVANSKKTVGPDESNSRKIKKTVTSEESKMTKKIKKKKKTDVLEVSELTKIKKKGVSDESKGAKIHYGNDSKLKQESSTSTIPVAPDTGVRNLEKKSEVETLHKKHSHFNKNKLKNILEASGSLAAAETVAADGVAAKTPDGASHRKEAKQSSGPKKKEAGNLRDRMIERLSAAR